jgi:hypothetical protein
MQPWCSAIFGSTVARSQTVEGTFLIHPISRELPPHQRQGVASQQVALPTTLDPRGLCRMSQSTKTRPWAILQALPLLVFYPDTLRSFIVMIQHPCIS